MKGHYRKKSKKALQVACLSACLVTAWAAPNYADGGSVFPVPEPASIAFAAVGVAAAVLVHKKKSRKR
jgi:hypothetical protein